MTTTSTWSASPAASGVRAQSGSDIARAGQSRTRIDGPLKVCGLAEYPGDVTLPGIVHAALAVSAIARGRVTSIYRDAAVAIPGVLLILTHEDVGDAIGPVGHLMEGGWANSSWRPLASPEIRYAGQIVAMVVAETSEIAAAAAAALRVGYAGQSPVASLADPRCETERLADVSPEHHDRRKGDLDAALAKAAVRIDGRYTTPIQHHNPIELPSTTCSWDGDRLTVYEPTRYLVAAQHGLASQLGIAPDRVRIISRFIGGHFGGKLALSQQTAICALAARRLGRPVRLEVSRRDQFTVANHRTETRHRIRLAATADGHLLGVGHDAATISSRFDNFAMEGTDVSTALYAADAVAAEERLGRVDRNTPGPMRAPPEVPFLFAIESAMDELAHTLNIDPIELRRRNDTLADPVTGKPFTTRPLMRCFDAAAAAFGWSDRVAQPRATLRDGWWIGHGCAAAARPVKIGAAAIRLAQDATGAVRVETAHHEIGNGLYTLLASIVSERLNVPLDRVTVALGDTALPPAGISGGSATTTSLANALAEACDALLRKPEGAREVRLDWLPAGAKPNALDELRAGHIKLITAPEDKLAWTFGAHLVEVRVHAATGEIRVPRHVGAFAAGRVLNPMAAHSQYIGGMAWGLGSALLEKTELDPRTGVYMNRDLGEYLVPTFADIVGQTVIMVPDDDPAVNPAGMKGLGEIGIIGVAAAVANAVFNATGARIRDLPIRPETALG
ncbi:xanthine dehydrogenase family protein molybdopterin-binding subunit [Sphingomonas prati]|uniref:Xanthine dehydrogenase YagR molybdenum-binding subunit n=1 Tax=Sphingomonas prati TaxID=1843237 RepID=A0A7W9BUW6_9SPHN|nr:xanthine dehydrogenase family protein molybdopterin-binding subunit [Sphingomonas prati]MBB5730465.1 xanthine dehydrogenase YagR molybdenum-binding subunit [Sphingomonas prati]GGE94265.1 oxidoreductase [Sphingomonas prati]